jgi:hypothetical protein
MEPKLLSRDDFREGVFKRDNHKCVLCSAPAQDAHHILERRLWPDGGYYLENGASVCGPCHLACERTTVSVEDVRFRAGITRIHVPPHFYPDHQYDKWGNPVLEDGRRGKGELYHDASAQKVLGEGGVLDLFTPYVKYERTFHLPFSPGMHDDDKALKDCSQFEGQRVICSLKKDGENTTGYHDGHVHARSIDSHGGEDRAWVKKFLIENVCFNLPEGWRICGENLWAEHSIHYDELESYFYGFSIWNERNECLSWDETIEYFELLGVQPVEVVYDGIWDEKKIRALCESLDTNVEEGLVVRVAKGFKYSEFRKSLAKYVRAGHVKTVSHWRHKLLVPNKLAS